MKTARIMAAAMLMAVGVFALHLAQSQQPRIEQHRFDTARGGRGRILRDGGLWCTSPRNGDRCCGPADSEPAWEAPVSLIVDYPPGASSASHRHARSAFIYAYVLSGEIRSQVDSEPARVYRPGESWFESPGAHHRVSANVSDTEPARLLAVFIVDAADAQLTTPDPQ